MVTLELQVPSTQQNQPGTFQQVDAVAALQQLSLQHRAARVASSRAAQDGQGAISTSPQVPHTVAHLAEKHRTTGEGTPRGRQSTSTRSWSTPHTYTNDVVRLSQRSTPHTYSNDGVRLSELVEKPLAIGTPRSPILQEEELSLAFQLPRMQLSVTLVYLVLLVTVCRFSAGSMSAAPKTILWSKAGQPTQSLQVTSILHDAYWQLLYNVKSTVVA